MPNSGTGSGSGPVGFGGRGATRISTDAHSMIGSGVCVRVGRSIFELELSEETVRERFVEFEYTAEAESRSSSSSCSVSETKAVIDLPSVVWDSAGGGPPNRPYPLLTDCDYTKTELRVTDGD